MTPTFLGIDHPDGPPAQLPISEPVIVTHDLTRSYRLGSSEVLALRGVNLTVQAGEFVALMGASGCGKTTLLSLLGCLDSPTDGSYWLEGRDTANLSMAERARIRGSRIGFVFQRFFLLANQTALENTALPLLYQEDSRQIDQRAQAALERVGLADRAAHRPNELSGGEQQRVAIARSLVTQPAILLADEPTGNLDSDTGQEIIAILEGLWAEGLTILLVTHDALVASHAQRTLHMKDGLIVSETFNSEKNDVTA